MNHSHPLPFLAASACLWLIALLPAPAAKPNDENAVIDLAALAEEGLNLRLATPTDLPLYVDRNAGRVLDVLPAKQTVTIRAMDRFGLQIQGRGRNGPITGWVGQKKLFAGQDAQLAKVRAFYERELKILKFVAEKSPAIGMNLAELQRTLGKPTNHMINASEETKTESVIWIIKEQVDLNEVLALGTDADLLKSEIETGRIEVELVEGLAKSIHMNLPNGANIPTIEPPVVDPFGPAPAKLAGK